MWALWDVTSDFRVTINETMGEVGDTKEGLTVLDFPGVGPILANLEFVWGNGETFRRQHISEVFSGSDVELTFVCMGKSPLAQSLWSTFQTWALCSEMLSE